MKATKVLRALGAAELEARIVEMKKELLKLRVQSSTGAAGTSSGKVRQVRKNIARAFTLQREKAVARGIEAGAYANNGGSSTKKSDAKNKAALSGKSSGPAGGVKQKKFREAGEVQKN